MACGCACRCAGRYLSRFLRYWEVRCLKTEKCRPNSRFSWSVREDLNSRPQSQAPRPCSSWLQLSVHGSWCSVASSCCERMRSTTLQRGSWSETVSIVSLKASSSSGIRGSKVCRFFPLIAARIRGFGIADVYHVQKYSHET